MKDIEITKKLLSKKYGLKEKRGERLILNTYDEIKQLGVGENAHFFLGNNKSAGKSSSDEKTYSVYSAGKRSFIAVDIPCKMINATRHKRIWDGYETIETPETYEVFEGAYFAGEDSKFYFIDNKGIHKSSFKRVMGANNFLYGLDEKNNIHLLRDSYGAMRSYLTYEETNPYKIFFVRYKSDLKDFNVSEFIQKTDNYFEKLKDLAHGDVEKVEVDKEREDFYEKFSKLNYLEKFEKEIESQINQRKNTIKEALVEKEELKKVGFSNLNLNYKGKAQEISSKIEKELEHLNERLKLAEEDVKQHSNLQKELEKMQTLSKSLAPSEKKNTEREM